MSRFTLLEQSHVRLELLEQPQNIWSWEAFTNYHNCLVPLQFIFHRPPNSALLLFFDLSSASLGTHECQKLRQRSNKSLEQEGSIPTTVRLIEPYN